MAPGVRWAGESRAGKAAPLGGCSGPEPSAAAKEKRPRSLAVPGAAAATPRSLRAKPRPRSPPPAPGPRPRPAHLRCCERTPRGPGCPSRAGPGERWRCRGLSTRNCCRQPRSTAQTNSRPRLQVSLLRSTGVQARVMLGSAAPRFLQGGSLSSQPSPAAVTAPWSVTSQCRAACIWAPGWACIVITPHVQ